MNGYCFSSNVSVNANNNNAMSPIFHPDGIPYEDKIPDSDIFMGDKFKTT